MKKSLLLNFLVLAVFLPQTVFGVLQTGDLAVVAYRSSVTSGNDMVAFLTFVDIPAGTTFNITDQKYNSANGTPQCPNFVTWTAPASVVPAGTVIIITTDATPNTTASIGTITTGGLTNFGLSSSGDQVFIYTGTTASPTYITAFSTKAWTAGAISGCPGNDSNLPPSLSDGTSSVNFASTPGGTGTLTTNAFYNGTQSGSIALLKSNIFNPANWVGTQANTAPQTWPTWTVSVTSIIKPNKDQSMLTVYPNPVKEGSMIYLNEEITGEVLDLTGKTMMNISAQKMFSVEKLNKGIYMIRTEDGIVRRFVID